MAVRMAHFIEYSPAVQEVPGSIPGWDTSFSDALWKGCRWLWSSLYRKLILSVGFLSLLVKTVTLVSLTKLFTEFKFFILIHVHALFILYIWSEWPPRVHSHDPSIRSHRGTKVVWPDFQPMRVPEEPVCIHSFRQNPVFTSLHLKSPIRVVPPLLYLQKNDI